MGCWGSKKRTHAGCVLAVAVSAAASPSWAQQTQGRWTSRPAATWQMAVTASRQRLRESEAAASAKDGLRRTVLARLERDFPQHHDWMIQDSGPSLDAWLVPGGSPGTERKAIAHVLSELGPGGNDLQAELDRLCRAALDAGKLEWLDLYVRACERRREIRLRPILRKWPRVVFTKHYNLGGSHYAYTEGQSDAQRERHFVPGSALCLLELDGARANVRTLIDDPNGVIRDPDVSHDGKRILFAWKKSDRQDDYHLYEMNVETRKIRQLTSGLGLADYEGAYLPNGDIIFNSTRCVQIVDCWWTEVSNLYACDKDGGHIRRLSYDQVHTNYPTVLDDGRVVYTRWEYSDRGQIYPQPLYQMNSDGTGQTEFYGNNSWFPTTILHARGIPDSLKLMAVASGHHTRQVGKLIVIDIGRGRQENAGVQLIAPVRETPAVHVDRYGQEGDLFQYPYPLSETEFLVAYTPFGWKRTSPRFNLYFMTADGRRELLAADPRTSCNQPVPLAPRPVPHLRPDGADGAETTGTYFLQDIYAGPGLQGVPRGAVKRLRVIALDYRAAGIRSNRNQGLAGAALISTPVAINNGAWDVKIVLGDAKVHEDGSACFNVPAHTPVYFQALDAKGHAVQTMRSWSTLQPGERFSCVGCHETKETAPPAGAAAPLALRTPPQRLAPFYGPPRGFSFIREIQPILDRHCVRCHYRDKQEGIVARAPDAFPPESCRALNDQRFARNSNDDSIERFTWWDHMGTDEWVQYEFDRPRTVAGASVYWFDDRPRGGRCRVPDSWRLTWRDEAGNWAGVDDASQYGLLRDRYNEVTFKPVRATAVRLAVKLQPEFSGGILEWRLDIPDPAASNDQSRRVAFSLMATQTPDLMAGRMWSHAYLELTNHGTPNRLVNWISAQSVPSMLPPYHAGAAKSELIAMIEKGHNDVTLSQEEMDKIACWIDLLVPYCGDYTEANAWTAEEIATYDHFLRKRRTVAAMERKDPAATAAR
ncbi:MAG: hypothetical protein JXQ73_28115 [Phycisphaerae bacterium]|nr:hypothetical protein [Phycisphaerae bacterium]